MSWGKCESRKRKKITKKMQVQLASLLAQWGKTITQVATSGLKRRKSASPTTQNAMADFNGMILR